MIFVLLIRSFTSKISIEAGGGLPHSKLWLRGLSPPPGIPIFYTTDDIKYACVMSSIKYYFVFKTILKMIIERWLGRDIEWALFDIYRNGSIWRNVHLMLIVSAVRTWVIKAPRKAIVIRSFPAAIPRFTRHLSYSRPTAVYSCFISDIASCMNEQKINS